VVLSWAWKLLQRGFCKQSWWQAQGSAVVAKRLFSAYPHPGTPQFWTAAGIGQYEICVVVGVAAGLVGRLVGLEN
jgi:hypothetical protein